MIHNTHVYKGCVILQYGYNLFVYKNGGVIHEKFNISEVTFAQELSIIVTMIDEGDI